MKIDEIEKSRNSFINDMGITEIKELIKVFIKHIIEEFHNNRDEWQNNEALMKDPNYEIKEIVNDFIIKMKINKIKNELVKDFIERIVKIEDKSECTSQLDELLYYDFISRITKIEKLAKVPNIFRIKIGKDKLEMDEDLFRLFCADENLIRLDGIDILAGKVLNNNDIAMLTRIGIFIFHLSRDFGLMSLNYFYYIHNLEESISKYDELIYGWVSYVKNDYENFLKYGTALLMFAIKLNDLKLINDIYKKCLKSFEKDPEINKEYLNIITTSLPLLKKFYPEYVSKFS